MSDRWIVSVIDDLETFAKCNCMPILARQLAVAHSVARSEIMAREVALEERDYEMPAELDVASRRHAVDQPHQYDHYERQKDLENSATYDRYFLSRYK